MAVDCGGDDANQSAHAVADEHGRPAHPASWATAITSSASPPADTTRAGRCPVAAEIRRDDVIVSRKLRCQGAPPHRVRGPSMHQDERRLGRVTPDDVVERTTCHRQRAALQRQGRGFDEPPRRESCGIKRSVWIRCKRSDDSFLRSCGSLDPIPGAPVGPRLCPTEWRLVRQWHLCSASPRFQPPKTPKPT